MDFEEMWLLSEGSEQGAIHGHLALSGKDFILALNSAHLPGLPHFPQIACAISWVISLRNCM